MTVAFSATDPSASTAAILSPGTVLDDALARTLVAWAQKQGLVLAVKQADSGCHLLGNEALAALLGCQEVEIAGSRDGDWLDPATAALLRAADNSALVQGQMLSSEHQLELRGERRDFRVLRVVAGSPEPAQAARLLVSVWQETTAQQRRDQQLKLALAQLEQQQKAHESLRRELAGQSLRDQASGLYSRAHFDDQMRRELDLSAREHREFALVYMALDAYSPQVQALGAGAHERICEAIGRLLRGNTRAMDASCRLDDDHFAVLLSGVGLATAHSRMEGLRRQCATQIVMLDGQELNFSVAMGVASFPHTAHSAEALLAACTAALAEARRRGGNVVALAAIRFEPV